MRNDQKNYACVEKCGVINIDTLVVEKTRSMETRTHSFPELRNEFTHNISDYKSEESGEAFKIDARDNDIDVALSTCDSCHQEDQIPNLSFKEEEPLINWETRVFQFRNTINNRIAQQVHQSAVISEETPIVRSGRRHNKGDDSPWKLDKVEVKTKLLCSNIKKSDCEDDNNDDVSGNTYYYDDENKRK